MTETRGVFKTGVSDEIYTNTQKLIKGNTVRDKFLVMADSVLFFDSDANSPGGYLSIDAANNNVDISFIKAISPSGKFLKDNGTWAAVDVLPDQSGNSGKFLSTNGTSLNWASMAPGGSDNQIQFNLSSAFTGSSRFVWENSNRYYKVDGYSLFGLSTTNDPTAFVDIAEATTARASLRIRSSGSTPSSPNEGDIWQDGDFIYIYMSTGTFKFMLEPA